MSLLADFFIASPEDLKDVDPTTLADKFPTVQTKRVDTVKLATLSAILVRRDNDETMPGVEVGMVQEFGDDGPWLLKLDPGIMNALAGLEPQQVDAYATEWARTEEWQKDQGTPDELALLLRDLSRLAARAVSVRKDVYLLISL
jgi:hypothetical protein